MLLKDSEYMGDSSFKQIEKLLDKVDYDGDEYKEEFEDLVMTMKKRD